MQWAIGILIFLVIVGSCSGGKNKSASSGSNTSNTSVSTASKEQTATLLNLNGLLCAEVIDIKPLKVKQDVYEVTCIEYRGGSGTKTYLMNTTKGTAWIP